MCPRTKNSMVVPREHALGRRYITRKKILGSVGTYEIVESHPEDKYLPSHLVLAASRFHILFATDVEGDNVRVVTAYRPAIDQWQTV
jgi:hypothetical protein